MLAEPATSPATPAAPRRALTPARGVLITTEETDPQKLRERCTRLELDVLRLRERLNKELTKVQGIQSMTMAMGASLELDQVLRVILDTVTRLLDADRSTIFLVDERREFLVSRVALGQEDGEFQLRMGEGIAGWVARNGRPVNLKDAYADRRFDPSFDQATGYRTRSMLCVPVHEPRRHKTLGVIQVLNRRQGYFSPADEELLRSIASQAAITIENSKLFTTVMLKNMELLEARDRLQEKVREVDQLYELSQQIQRASTEQELVDGVLERTLRLLPCEMAGLLLIDNDGGRLRYATKPVDRQGTRGALRLAPGEGLVGRAVQEGACMASEWLSEDAPHRVRLSEETGITLRTCLAAPLVANGRPLGALQVANRKGPVRRFSPEDIKLLGLIADHAASAVDLQRQIADRAQRERLASIGQLLSAVLHDIKGPISVISGYVQLMIKKDSAAERERYGQIIHRQFESFGAMTQEVLAFARGETALLVRRCYLQRFLADLEEQIRPLVEGKGVVLTIRDDYRGAAHFDQVKITRCLVNLVKNAVEAMEHGGHLQVLASREGQDLIFTVADTGPGIPEEIRGRLFGAFVTQGKAEGTGLGLAIARKVVEEHGGTIRFESEPGVGTRFDIRLPQPEVKEEEGLKLLASQGTPPAAPARPDGEHT